VFFLYEAVLKEEPVTLNETLVLTSLLAQGYKELARVCLFICLVIERLFTGAVSGSDQMCLDWNDTALL
jgi:hypothetical protein